MEPAKKKKKLNIKKISLNDNIDTIQESFDSFYQQKANKICHEHYDHSYAKNIIIDCVNDDCLAEIFTYVPIFERPKIALVCKKWKRALDDSWYKVKSWESTYWRYDDEDQNCLAQYPAIGNISFLQFIFKKCGRYLTTLDLTAYDRCNIVPVINKSCPKLLKLRLRFTNLFPTSLANSFTRLSKLASLTVVFENTKNFQLLPPVALINSLRNVADTLTDLSLLNIIDDFDGKIPDFTSAITNVISHLKALKTLECAGIRILGCFSKYVNEKNILYFNHTTFCRLQLHMERSLTAIEELRLSDCPVKDETLYIMANSLECLKLLHLDTDWVTDHGIVAISKMKGLEVLNFTGHAEMTDSSLKLLRNFTNLALPASIHVSDDAILEVLDNSPDIISLSVYGIDVTAKFVKKVAEISAMRKKHLTLFVKKMPGLKEYESVYLELHLFEKKNEIIKISI